jgi:hypothetical protein
MVADLRDSARRADRVTPLALLLGRIGWTTGELAARLNASPDTTRSWANGRRSTPPSVLPWLGEIATAMETVRAHEWEPLQD